MHKLSIIIPCFFNEKNIPETTKRLSKVENKIKDKVVFEYIFVDDGSKDETLKKLKLFKASQTTSIIKIIKLSGNFGSYNAISAGLKFATGNCIVIISADLQDPPELIEKMFIKWSDGFKLVIANRINRNDPYLSKFFSNLFHFLVKKIAIREVPEGGFDLILFDKEIQSKLLKMSLSNTHIFYLISSLKYEYCAIPYERQKREIGKSKWTFSKKLKLFIDTIVSFSYLPLRLISITGIIMGFSSIIYVLYIIYNKINGTIAIEGWSSLMVVFLFVSSFVMISIGVLGEYIWRIMDEIKNKPNYVIDEIL